MFTCFVACFVDLHMTSIQSTCIWFEGLKSHPSNPEFCPPTKTNPVNWICPIHIFLHVRVGLGSLWNTHVYMKYTTWSRCPGWHPTIFFGGEKRCFGSLFGGSKYLLFGGVKRITNHSLLRGLLTHSDPWFLTTYVPSWDPILQEFPSHNGWSLPHPRHWWLFRFFLYLLCRYSSASDAILIFDASDRLWSLPMKQARAQDALTRGQGTKENGGCCGVFLGIWGGLGAEFWQVKLEWTYI